MVSQDSRRTGFNGVALGRTQVYGTVADAVCVQNPRHRCPSSWCDCGFYCFHDRDEARALACDPEYPGSVVLDVLASGRFIGYERGLRYARQTAEVVRVGRCACGRRATAFVGAASGVAGWRRLTPMCPACAGTRPGLSFVEFGRRAVDPQAPARTASLVVRADETVDADPAPVPPRADAPDADRGEASLVSVLTAEVALLQARLDDLQARVDELTRRDG